MIEHQDQRLPSREEMSRAFLARDTSYDGVFFATVATTGIFCRPSCPARKPSLDNVEYVATARDALLNGYRPCKRCHPLEPVGATPAWLRPLLVELEDDPLRRWKDEDLRQRGLSPERVRRWFQENHGMTFHAYHRARRLGLALGGLRHGADATSSAFDHGYESTSGFNEAFRQLFGVPAGSAGETAVVTVTRLITPLGPMLAGATDDGICLLEFVDRRMLETQLTRLRRGLGTAMVPGSTPLLEQVTGQLDAYFEGSLRDFTVPLTTPGSDFQREVWRHLRELAYGATISYGELARRIGRPTASRAVARANGDNRIAIIIPCHRVIGSDGSLTGYGGGLWRKRRLLEHEAMHSGHGVQQSLLEPEVAPEGSGS